MAITRDDIVKAADKLASEVPLFGGKVKAGLHKIIDSDELNHNGVSDILEILIIAENTIGPVTKIVSSIDLDKLEEQIKAIENAAIKNKALLLEGLCELKKLAEIAAQLAPKK